MVSRNPGFRLPFYKPKEHYLVFDASVRKTRSIVSDYLHAMSLVDPMLALFQHVEPFNYGTSNIRRPNLDAVFKLRTD